MPRGVSRYDEALLQGRLWTPAEDRARDLAAWYDASVFGPLTADSSLRISSLDDRSGRGLTATQATDASKVTFAVNRFPGRRLPSFKPQGNTSFMNSNIPATAGMSMFVAMENSASAVMKNLFGGQSGAPQLRLESTQQLHIIRALQAGIHLTTMTVPTGGNIIGSDTSSAGVAVWLNGVAETSATNPAFTTNLVYLFASFADTQLDADSSIGEFVFYNVRLPRWRRDQVDGYLAWKWGAVDRLHSSHPYKRFPPLIGA